MHIGDTPEEAAYRAEARAWLEAHATRKSDAHPGDSDLQARTQKS